MDYSTFLFKSPISNFMLYVTVTIGSHLIQLELSHQIEAVCLLTFLDLQYFCFRTPSLIPNDMDTDMFLEAVNFGQIHISSCFSEGI